MIIPEEYDWRKVHPHCVRESVPMIDRSCASSYVVASQGAVEDRLCRDTGKLIELSADEVIDCDHTNHGCKGGNANRVLTWGKRKGFIAKECYEKSVPRVCPTDHLTMNTCRQSNNIYKVVDFCLAKEVNGIKREILTNGPVVAHMSPYTDFLTYAEGAYRRTEGAFKYNGQHLVKIIGWELLS